MERIYRNRGSGRRRNKAKHDFFRKLPVLTWITAVGVWIVVLNPTLPSQIRNAASKLVPVQMQSASSSSEKSLPGERIRHRADSIMDGTAVYSTDSLYRPGPEGGVWDANMLGLSYLKQSVYRDLSMQEKLNALQTLLDIETQYLFDAPGEVELCCAATKDGTLGYYILGYSTIVISEKALNDRDRAVSCILHEARHAYQERVVQYLEEAGVYDTTLLKETEVYAWRSEENHYVSGQEDIENYYSQRIEQDAREYSEKWLEAYLTFIEEI